MESNINTQPTNQTTSWVTSWDLSVFSPEIETILNPFKKEIMEVNEKWEASLQSFAKKLNIPKEKYTNLPKAFEEATYERIKEKWKAEKTVIGICWPGASGKNTVKEMLSDVKMVINTTTRAQRNNETQDVHYHFFSEEDFQKDKEAWKFLTTTYREWRGNYGIQKEDILWSMKENSTFIIEENPETIFKVSEELKKIDTSYSSILVYILPPSPIIVTLASRLAKRSLTSWESPQSLLDTVLWDRQHDEFLSVLNLMEKMNVLFVVNDTPSRAKEVIESLYLK